MFLRGSGSNWEVRAPAKVNLLLEVFARRSDGFHEIETLMIPISLCDTLYFASRPATKRIELRCQAIGSRPGTYSKFAGIPTGEENIVVQAVRRLREQAGTTAGAMIRLVKRIPLAAGLGGGSSDAAAALAVANLAWNIHWSTDRLSSLAAELGSDVPFFLGSGGAVCRGRGEQIRRVTGLGHLHLVVVKPPVGLATENVYADVRSTTKPRKVAPLIHALQRGDMNIVGRLMHNQLQKAAERLTPWIERLIQEFNKLDCIGHQMTGSGSSYFGIFRSARHARCIATKLRSRDIGSVFVTCSCQ